tara:strand:+ start:546 stop:983 length:438 start_codon:yes stop_codon:yes gene_type:complete
MVGPGGGEGAARPVEDVRWWLCGNGDGGAIEVGVAIGVFWEDETAVMDGCFAVGTSPTYLSPSSPGAKVRVEQKPSEEVIRRVKPSLDLEHELGTTIARVDDLPSQIRECGTVEVAHYTQRSLLLGVIHQYRVFRSHSVDHPVWK